MKIVTIVGARPQFIKAATISRAIRSHNEKRDAHQIEEIIVHTGQHYDEKMSQVFFDELDIPQPQYHLGIGNSSHGAMTGRMLEKIEQVLLAEQPDWVLVYGDTNSTLAGVLAAVKLHISVAHVEAGLRSFNMHMPEEVNRILSDRVSSLLLCPTDTAVVNLRKEGLNDGVHLVGDVMYDASLFYRERARKTSYIMAELKLQEKEYVLATCHRAENTDDSDRLQEIALGLASIAKGIPVILPMHPGARKKFIEYDLMGKLGAVEVIEPVSYLDMVRLEESAVAILTDSGGIQKEAFFFSVPCLTMRDETEWVETVDSGWNKLVGADMHRITEGFRTLSDSAERVSEQSCFGQGDAAEKIVAQLSCSVKKRGQ